METPTSFLQIDLREDLLDKVMRLGYARDAHFVAIWWDEDDDQLAWADSDLKVAVGVGDNEFWLSEVRPVLHEFALGSVGVKARQVLVWDRQEDLLWIAPRKDGIMFLCNEVLCSRQSNGSIH